MTDHIEPPSSSSSGDDMDWQTISIGTDILFCSDSGWYS